MTTPAATVLLLFSLLFLSHAVPDVSKQNKEMQEQPAILLPSETAEEDKYSSLATAATTDANPSEAISTAAEGEGEGEEATSDVSASRIEASYIPVRVRFLPIDDAARLGDLRSAGRRFRFFIPHHHHHQGRFRQMEGVRMGGFRGKAALMDENEKPEEGKMVRYSFRRPGMRHHCNHQHHDLDGEGHMMWRRERREGHGHGGLMNRFWVFLNRF